VWLAWNHEVKLGLGALRTVPNRIQQARCGSGLMGDYEDVGRL
jgi:hypothetical protein